ncbi:hypothetical protein PoB_000714400 [Plakobranchus ocellatus]|uniref:Uncharacterized protein n=1 Tax=Plakobranchus ocellatus TaxID=259542 RepID=A0AAV3YC83_9GAST|nr:hypothetical protein PoB_000714400 [Plakobranchus ocellatus]
MIVPSMKTLDTFEHGAKNRRSVQYANRPISLNGKTPLALWNIYSVTSLDCDASGNGAPSELKVEPRRRRWGSNPGLRASSLSIVPPTSRNRMTA